MRSIKSLFSVALMSVCLVGCGSSTAAAKDYTKYSDDLRPDYQVCANKIVTHYVNVEVPEVTDSDFVTSDFDDQDDGYVMVSFPAAVSGQTDKVNVYLVEQIADKDDGKTHYYGHYLCVDGKLYIDDGTASDVMAKLGMPTASPSSN